MGMWAPFSSSCVQSFIRKGCARSCEEHLPPGGFIPLAKRLKRSAQTPIKPPVFRSFSMDSGSFRFDAWLNPFQRSKSKRWYSNVLRLTFFKHISSEPTLTVASPSGPSRKSYIWHRFTVNVSTKITFWRHLPLPATKKRHPIWDVCVLIWLWRLPFGVCLSLWRMSTRSQHNPW